MATSPSLGLEWTALGPALLAVQFFAIFLAIPLLVYERVLPGWPIRLLLVAGAWALWSLSRDPAVNLRGLFRWNFAAVDWRTVLLRDAFLIAVLVCAVWYSAPDLLFAFVKKAPLRWALLMVLYPILSVLPQEILFRGYFFQRYRGLFGAGIGLTLVNALSFGFVHIIFGNWIAVVLSAIGGVLFASTYRQSGSLLLVSFEHAVFGNFLFTIGLGQYFYQLHHF